jgi:hypothetical protein
MLIKDMKTIKKLAIMLSVLTPSVVLSVFSMLAVLFMPLSADLKVYPRIITPGLTAENDRVFFDFTDYDDPKPKLSIFDLNGRKIKDISALNPQPVITGWRLYWDGRDSGGNPVMPGVYVYQFEEGTKETTGTIVVSR